MLKELASLLCSLFVPRRAVSLSGGKIIYGENLSTVGLTDFSESVTATSLPYVVPFDGYAVISWQAVWSGSPTLLGSQSYLIATTYIRQSKQKGCLMCFLFR